MDNLKDYRVIYQVMGPAGGRFFEDRLIFRCWAEDEEHAREQFLDAHPNDKLVAIELEEMAE